MTNLFSCLSGSLNRVIVPEPEFVLPGTHEGFKRGVLPRGCAGFNFGMLIVRLTFTGKFGAAADGREDAAF